MPETTDERLAALTDRLPAPAGPEPRPSPFAAVDEALDALSDAVEALPFAGHDQRVRGRDMLARIAREFHSVQLRQEDQ